jgi:hypothetical protein
MEEHLRTASAEDVARALRTGGRAAVTLRSKESGMHVSIVLSVRQAKPGGGFVSRGTKAGRVGIEAAAAVPKSVIEARDPSVEYPDNYVGRLYLTEGEWRSGRDADSIRAWAAEKTLLFALSGYDLLAKAEVFLATECSYCGKGLRDPESIERGVGPECFGKRTKSKRAPDQLALSVVATAKETIEAALAAGNPLWMVLDGIADDENLEGAKAELTAYAEEIFGEQPPADFVPDMYDPSRADGEPTISHGIPAHVAARWGAAEISGMPESYFRDQREAGLL